MAGGTGTRLWPLSRKSTPKQFQKFVGDQTLLQQTYDRIIQVVDPANVWVQTAEDYASLVAEQLPAIKKEHIITEPSARNTAPATGLATMRVLAEDPDAVLFGLLPADHYVGKPDVFAKTTNALFEFLEKNPEYVATIGVYPTEANTGLGYIKKGEQLAVIDEQEILRVASFIEKPDQKSANKFLRSGNYLWNGGYYLFNGAQLMEYYQQYAPEIFAALTKFVADPGNSETYNQIPSVPIDKAISEKLDKLAVISADMQWSDIGNWAALHQILSEQGESNEIVSGNHVGDAGHNTLVMGGNKLIATVGLQDVVVIDTEDVILVCHKDAVQDVKKIVEQLQAQGRGEYL